MSEPEPTVLVDVSPSFEHQVDEAAVERAVRGAIRAAVEGETPDAISSVTQPISWDRVEVGVRVTDDAELHRLNSEYRGVDKPTDVLSFSFIEEQRGPTLRLTSDMPFQLGEIAVSYPHVVRQAEELGHPEEMELAWLVIHGTLQLLGYTHDIDETAERMEELERAALRTLGFQVE
jgi:probable rRNA maturation factor